MSHPTSQQESPTNTPTDSDSQLSVDRETIITPTFNQEESSCSSETRAESSSSRSSSSSSSTCSGEDKVEIECIAMGCHKTAYKSRKYFLLPWRCKYHRNRTYKETYKKRKAMANKGTFNTQHIRQSTDPQDDRQGVPLRQGAAQQGNMLEQVLNEKKMALLQSPVILNFLQKQQQKKQHQHKHQRKPWELQHHGFGPPSHR